MSDSESTVVSMQTMAKVSRVVDERAMYLFIKLLHTSVDACALFVAKLVEQCLDMRMGKPTNVLALKCAATGFTNYNYNIPVDLTMELGFFVCRQFDSNCRISKVIMNADGKSATCETKDFKSVKLGQQFYASNFSGDNDVSIRRLCRLVAGFVESANMHYAEFKRLAMTDDPHVFADAEERISNYACNMVDARDAQIVRQLCESIVDGAALMYIGWIADRCYHNTICDGRELFRIFGDGSIDHPIKSVIFRMQVIPLKPVFHVDRIMFDRPQTRGITVREAGTPPPFFQCSFSFDSPDNVIALKLQTSVWACVMSLQRYLSATQYQNQPETGPVASVASIANTMNGLDINK